MRSGALRPIGWLEHCLLDQHSAGAGWISRAILTAEPFPVDRLARAAADLAGEFPILRIAPHRGEWIERDEAIGALEDPRDDAKAVVIDHLNRVADPRHDPLHVFTPIGSTADHCTGVVIGSSHALSDGATMTALATRIVRSIHDESAITPDPPAWRFAPSLEDAIGTRTRRQLTTAMLGQLRSGYLRAALTTWATARRAGDPHERPSSNLVSTTVASSVAPADRYSVVRDACARLVGRPSRILTTVDVRQQRPGLDDCVGYLASGFVARHTSNPGHRSRRASWEDPPTLHRALSRLTRRTPTPAVDLAISVQHTSGSTPGTMFGGASVHGFGIPVHVFMHGDANTVAITVIFDERRSSADSASRVLDDIAVSLAGNRLHRSEEP